MLERKKIPEFNFFGRMISRYDVNLGERDADWEQDATVMMTAKRLRRNLILLYKNDINYNRTIEFVKWPFEAENSMTLISALSMS